MNSFGVLLIALVLFLPLVVGTWLFIDAYRRHARHYDADKAVERFRRATTYSADPLGNYPAFFNHKTGDAFLPPPGNRAFPEQIMLVNGVQRPVHPEQERPLVLNYGRPRPGGEQVENSTAVQGEQYSRSGTVQGEQFLQEAEFKELPEPEQARSVAEIQRILYTLKKEGRLGKEEAIKQAAQLPGKGRNSKAYRTWSDYWDNLNVEARQ